MACIMVSLLSKITKKSLRGTTLGIPDEWKVRENEMLPCLPVCYVVRVIRTVFTPFVFCFFVLANAF